MKQLVRPAAISRTNIQLPLIKQKSLYMCVHATIMPAPSASMYTTEYSWKAKCAHIEVQHCKRLAVYVCESGVVDADVTPEVGNSVPQQQRKRRLVPGLYLGLRGME